VFIAFLHFFLFPDEEGIIVGVEDGAMTESQLGITHEGDDVVSSEMMQ
jgi:hypothetical protein